MHTSLGFDWFGWIVLIKSENLNTVYDRYGLAGQFWQMESTQRFHCPEVIQFQQSYFMFVLLWLGL